MNDYALSFSLDDRERVFGFLALFSRWEYALKATTFWRNGQYAHAEADWDAFANNISGELPALAADARFNDAQQYLVQHPPRQQKCMQNPERIEWADNPRRPKETDASYLFRVIRDIRNNLFHGGKFSGYAEELARDRQLIDSATKILEACVSLRENIEHAFANPR